MARLWTDYQRWMVCTGTNGMVVLWRNSTASRPSRWVQEFPQDRADASTVEVAEFLAAQGVPPEEWLTAEALAELGLTDRLTVPS